MMHFKCEGIDNYTFMKLVFYVEWIFAFSEYVS